MRVPGLLPGSYKVDVRCEGFVSAPSYPPLAIADRSLRELRWEVRPGQTIRGTVVATTREPVTATTVTVSPQVDPSRSNAQSTSGHAEADHAGRFEFTGLLPGRYALRVLAGDPPQLLQGPEVEVREGHDLDDLRIELPAAGEVRGEVRDVHGRAIAGARVLLRGPNYAQTTSLDDGSFRLSGLAAGAYQASVSKSYQPMRMHDAKDGDEPRVQVETGETAVLDLVVEAPDGRITGRVVDGDEAAQDDVFVEVLHEPESGAPGAALRDMRWSMDRGLRPRMTDVDGRFELGDLPEGTYTLVAHRRGGGEGSSSAWRWAARSSSRSPRRERWSEGCARPAAAGRSDSRWSSAMWRPATRYETASSAPTGRSRSRRCLQASSWSRSRHRKARARPRSRWRRASADRSRSRWRVA
ncbi:carboxypeptidase regulatory-like domain-containing protein [Nannocystis pusilla]|uniref:carboxypeptidase regulatory-like domain-containing protein n=1 Tax=Nannocystis pusilla TaxID=889268 RepID=UPI003B774595